jgi:hypothetical protein
MSVALVCGVNDVNDLCTLLAILGGTRGLHCKLNDKELATVSLYLILNGNTCNAIFSLEAYCCAEQGLPSL